MSERERQQRLEEEEIQKECAVRRDAEAPQDIAPRRQRPSRHDGTYAQGHRGDDREHHTDDT